MLTHFPVTIPTDKKFDYIQEGIKKLCGEDNYGLAGRHKDRAWGVTIMVPADDTAKVFSYLFLALQGGYITSLGMKTLGEEYCRPMPETFTATIPGTGTEVRFVMPGEEARHER